jgi:hypothetical protein
MKKHFITTTALAGVFAIGIAGAPFAQGVNPGAPGSAAGGTMAQGGQTGAGTQGGQAGTPGGAATQGGQARTQDGAARPGGQAGTQGGAAQGGAATQGGQPRTQDGAARPGGQTGTQGGAATQGGQTGTQGGAAAPGSRSGTQGGAMLQGNHTMAQANVPGSQMGATPGGAMGQRGGQTGTTAGQPGATGTSQQASMNEEQVRGILSARGYSDISGIERDGDYFKVGEAKRYGRDVEDLRVNARTGQVRDEARLNEDQARNLLEQRGYSEISDVERDGDTITAKAKRDDREMRVRIDGNTGAVMPQPSSN